MEFTKKIAVIQADDRLELDYLPISRSVNTKASELFNYQYLFLDLNYIEHEDIFPAIKKIYAINDTLTYSEFDIIVFLDSDAWIQNCYWLNDIISNLINDEKKHGCFSRDPYAKPNTYINSGSFIIKNNDYTKKMYKTLIDTLDNDTSYHNEWPYDQHYVSDYIHKHKDDFTIFIPDILNTPTGKVLRHNWHKNFKMHFELSCLNENIDSNKYINKSKFEQEKYYDTEVFPNIQEIAYEYLI